MNTFGKFVSSVAEALDFNQATLSGCVDIVVVQQEDGSLKSTPFHARFGKLKVLKSKDKTVKIHVNERETSLTMRLGSAGEAYFAEESHQTEIMVVEEPIIIPDGESSQMGLIQENVKQGGLKEMLKMRHTASNQSTSATSKVAGGVASDDAYDGKMEVENDADVKNLDEMYLMQSSTSSTKSKKSKVKALRPNSDALKSLNLRLGANTITYTVSSSLQGSQTVSGFIYYWPKNANIIVSDVDGTITKTDFLGHVLPKFGKDWSQPGIAPLFTNLRKNGYYILYLTSRPIGQSQQTKNFLQSVYQDGKMLPQGPLVMSPDRMLPSVKREIIFKRPELFKIAALKDIRSLFPAHHNPFHAGFGNRETDAISYRSVGIPLEKVYIVDPNGDIQHHNCETTKSYALINHMIKDLFPHIIHHEKMKLAEALKEENVLTLENELAIAENTVKVVS